MGSATAPGPLGALTIGPAARPNRLGPSRRNHPGPHPRMAPDAEKRPLLHV